MKNQATEEPQKETTGRFHGLNFDTILEMDKSIRFVGICTVDGRLLDVKYKKGVEPLLTSSGLQLSAMRTAIRSSTRTGDEGQMGKPIYSVTEYQNVKRATIPIAEDLLFLVSFSKDTDESKLVPKIVSALT